MWFFCSGKKQKIMEERIDRLCRMCLKLKEENRTLSSYKDSLEHLSGLSDDKTQIIGCIKKDENYYIATTSEIPKEYDMSTYDEAKLCLFKLPYTRPKDCLAQMNVFLRSGCRVKIVDWSAASINCGYGSILMGLAIKYFRNAGFQCIYGYISFVDSDHEDLLIHFYRKFGFQIGSHDRFTRIDLNLRNDSRDILKHSAYELCVRAAAYDFIK